MKRLLFLVACCTSPALAQRPLKVLISADMEGIAGVVSADQLGPASFEYAQARTWMTGEVNAAIAGAREAGATEIVVADSHGNMQNLLLDQLPSDVTVVRGSPRPLIMMEGIDSTFAAVIFVGYHSSTTNLTGVRAHTISSATFTSVAINGTPMTEGSINAAIAGHFRVPVVLVTGDEAAVNEVRQLVPGAMGAVVKRGISFHSAATMTPQAARDLIRTRAKAAIEQRAAARPYVIPAPLTLDLSFKHYRVPEVLAYLPIVERTTSHTIRYRPRDILELAKFLEFVTTYSTDLTP